MTMPLLCVWFCYSDKYILHPISSLVFFQFWHNTSLDPSSFFSNASYFHSRRRIFWRYKYWSFFWISIEFWKFESNDSSGLKHWHLFILAIIEETTLIRRLDIPIEIFCEGPQVHSVVTLRQSIADFHSVNWISFTFIQLQLQKRAKTPTLQ
jgi:hypothetical protein